MAWSSRVVHALILGFAISALEGCAASLSQPFDHMKDAPITVFRLQNYEPPPQTSSAAGAVPFALPPEIMVGAQRLASMLGPLVPPGLLPGQTPPIVAANVQRFHGFPILGWMAVNDPKQHDEVLDVLGRPANFVTEHGNCLYAEVGLSIAQVNAPPADVLVSLTCHQVQAQGFLWPYAASGLSGTTEARIAAIVQKVFGG